MNKIKTTPAGLGKLYVCPQKDFEAGTDTPLHEIPLEHADGTEGNQPKEEKKGFACSANFVFETTPEYDKTLRKLLNLHGRMPRRRKKRMLNSVLRHRKHILKVLDYLPGEYFPARQYVLKVMLSGGVRMEGLGKIVVSETDYRLAFLCIKRLLMGLRHGLDRVLRKAR